jgi:hypothetical protein
MTISSHGTISDESTISHFDPENEAIMSTRQLEDNTTNRLPELRDTAKKFGRWNKPEPEIQINTSAIGRAFPDFSMGGSSDEDSIEIGRGGKRAADSQISRFESAQFNGTDSNPMIGSFEVMGTPPLRPSKSYKVPKATQQSPPAKTTNFGTNRSGTGEQRRSLKDLHARVSEEYDGSLLSDERPTVTSIPVRKTRFGSVQRNVSTASGNNNTTPKKFTTTESLLRDVTSNLNKSASKQQHQNPTESGTLNMGGTQQSFLLPDLPNISELVSGVYQDGTPVFSRHGKSRSRFASSTSKPENSKSTHEHLPIESLPIPDEEKQIFVSLRLLQDKVAGLETDKADMEQGNEDLQAEINILKAQMKEKERQRRSDSALGMTADNDSDSSPHGNTTRIASKFITNAVFTADVTNKLQNSRQTSNHSKIDSAL